MPNTYLRKVPRPDEHAFSVKLEAAGKTALRLVRGHLEDERKEAAMRASCLILVRHGFSAFNSMRLINSILPVHIKPFRNKWELFDITGGRDQVIARLQAGGVLSSGALGEWTPDFLNGMVKSGCVCAASGQHRWMVQWLRGRPAFKKALFKLRDELPFNFKLSKSGNRKGFVLSGAWAFDIGADDPAGIGILAGLLAGGRYVRYEGVSWIALVKRVNIVEILDSFRIPYRDVSFGQPQRVLLVSPFWGALLSWEMPKVFREWFMGWDGFKGMCPLLPWAFLRAAWGERICFGFSKGVVPFLVGRKCLIGNHGIGIKQVRERAFRDLGFTGVDTRVRQAWLHWMLKTGVGVGDFPVGKLPLDFIGS